MVWFDNRSSVSSNSRRRSPRRSNSIYSNKHSRSSAPSLFPGAAASNGYGHGYGGGGSSSTNRRSKSPSFFSMSSSSSSSSRRAKPRAGFVHRVVRYIRKLLRDIYRYMRHHPIKTFLVVVVPMVMSGVLQKLLAMIGVPLPKGAWTPGEGLLGQIGSLFKVVKMIL